MTAKLPAVLATYPWLPYRFTLSCNLNEADFVEVPIKSALLHKTHPLFFCYFFFLGAITITICRPSILGNCSTMANSSKSFSMRFNTSMPSSR